MVRFSWKVYITLVLLGSSALLALLHVAFFRDPATLSFYVALDVVFVPIQVLLVTVIIERLLFEREKQMMLKKLNMVIGAFFGEVGNRLIRLMKSACTDGSFLEKALSITGDWESGEFREAASRVSQYECRFDPKSEQLAEMKSFLLEQRNFVLGLLQNPNLLEHDNFTDLLWAVCHITEELEARLDLTNLPRSDIRHIEEDIRRCFGLLVREWLAYIEHLKVNYPYMYSLYVRLNPFNPEASAVVRMQAEDLSVRQ